jgi:hypothetical protein
VAQLVDEKDAKQIYQNLLDKICYAYFENDFDAFQDSLHVPHHYRTESDAQQIDNIDQLRRVFHCFRDYFLGLRVTDFIRTCTGTALLGPNEFSASHMTELVRNGTRLRQPYEVWAIVKRIDGIWKVASSENAISDTSWQAHAFRQGAELKHEPPQGRTDR